MPSSLAWHFDTTKKRPRIHGLNDAGIATFRGDYYRSLARETIQNSLDAKDSTAKGPVTVEFDRFDLPSKQFPDVAGLKQTFDDCSDFFSEINKQTVEFFERAVKAVNKKNIPVLRIGDSGTTGLTGNDEDINSPWVCLTGASGLSGKAAGSGGSYGIGQNAPFAASDIRTVLYSTCTARNQQRFLGVARLVTHKRGGKWCLHEGCLGQNSGESVTAKSQIPARFLRSTKGTDLFILAFKDEGNWQRELEVSVLDNFWPAILQKTLVVKIGKTTISHRNLKQMLEQLDPNAESDALAYYLAYTEPDREFRETLDTIGNCIYRAIVGDEPSPRKVAMIRRSGMVIYRREFRFGVPYCGVFHCDDEEGNEVLRRMEPPAHDKWDKDLPEKGSHANVDNTIRDFVRDCMKELQPDMDDEEIEIDELDEYLPDYEDEAEGADPREAFPDQFDKNEPRKSLPVDNVKQRIEGPSGAGDNEGNFGEGESGEAGSDGEGGGNQERGRGGSSGSPSVPVRYRAFPSDAAGTEYECHVRVDEAAPRKLHLALRASGDDILEPLRVAEARLPNGKRIPLSGGGFRIGPVNMKKNQPLSLSIRLADPMAVAVEVIAHEADN